MDFHFPNLLPLVVIGGSFTFTGAILYGAWLLGRYRGREEEAPAALLDMEERLFRLEQAVGQTARALERMEAAHRLTARLLTDKSSSAGSASARARTPQ
jgi:hypothetical protein